MTVDREWVVRNLGFDPVKVPPPSNTFSFQPAARTRSHEDLEREIIDFDSDSPEGLNFFAFSKATGLSRFTDIPWPDGLAPQTAAAAGGDEGGPLPKADVLVVTWTVDEGHALSRVLTPGKDSRNDYLSYTHNYDTISKDMRAGCPAVEAKRLGAYWMTTIDGKSVVIFKSDSHMSQDGPKLPNITVWRQIIEEVQPKLVITTGTGGGVGDKCEVGDVTVSAVVRFDCLQKFKAEPFAKESYTSAPADASHFAEAEKLMLTNAGQLPPDNSRPPRIMVTAPDDLPDSIMTTDFFGFDTSDDHWHLQGLASICEMGDAVLGLVAKEMGEAAPPWLAIRNVSDPQIKAEGTLSDQATVAGTIYKGFGRWSSVCSALACWASIVALP
jgi:nucleoside phosphorylase